MVNGVATWDEISRDNGLFDNRITGEWLSTKEAASYLGISANALRILVHRGRVQAHKLGSRLKFKIKDLRASLTKREA